ncbi:MAG: hypothetical protein ACFFCS_10855 [Candidatus Hodarchaeota archaeon]
MSELKKFNIVIKEAIRKAQLYEKNELWHKARDEWLDIIEYCLLFADKTPDIKRSTKEMISEKAQNLMKRVDKIDEKITVEEITESPAVEAQISDEDQATIGIEDSGSSDTSISINDEQDTITIVDDTPAPKEKKFVEIGEEKIEIPDDFPLIEITPKDSFKPAEVASEKVKIDSTIHYVDKDEESTTSEGGPSRESSDEDVDPSEL